MTSAQLEKRLVAAGTTLELRKIIFEVIEDCLPKPGERSRKYDSYSESYVRRGKMSAILKTKLRAKRLLFGSH